MVRYALIALFSAGVLGAQGNAPPLDVRVSAETVPAGGTAQIKVYLGTPQPISNGNIVLEFTGIGGQPGSPPPVQAATVFSATGDVSAVGKVDQLGPTFTLLFNSPSAGVGRLPEVPLLEFSMPVGNGFSIALTPSSSFSGPAGNYAMTTQPGGATIGGFLSIQTVTPTGSTGVLPAGSALMITGTGFQSATSIMIEGVSVTSVVIASASLIQVTLGGATEITGKRIVLANPGGSQITYWGGLGTSLYTFPLSSTSSAICGRMGPAYHDPVILVVQNPNSISAQVTIGNIFPSGSQTVTVPSGGSYQTNILDPPYSTVQSDSATPIRILGFVSYSSSFDPLTILPVISQIGPVPSIGSIVNGASEAQSAVSPGEIVTIHGINAGPIAPAGMMLDSSGNVGRVLNGAQVLFNGIAAPLLYASASQVNAVVPYEISPYSVTTVQVEYNGAISAAWDVPVATTAPAIFTLSGSGQGGAAVLNQDNSVNSSANPAQPGSILQIYATGEGLTSPVATTGVIVPDGSLRSTPLPVSVTIAGEDALVLYDGSAPGAVAGLFQVNAQVPMDLTPSLSVPVVLRVGSGASQMAVTVAIR
jgi:uncharacterized protein (TIGR03437 family)